MKKKRGSGLIQFTNEILFNKYDYNNSSKQILNSYGENIIYSIVVRKSPIMSMINSFIKNNTQKLPYYNYDKFYHLDIVINDKIKIEKNERINISLDLSINRNEVHYYPIYNIPSNLKIIDFLNNYRKNIDDEKYFTYHAFTNNCQIFILNLLKYNNILNQELYNFIKQDVNFIYKNNKRIVKTSKFITDVAGRFNSLFY